MQVSGHPSENRTFANFRERTPRDFGSIELLEWKINVYYFQGEYNVYNISSNLRYLPATLPFRKGRVYANMTIAETGESWAVLYIDVEVKEYTVKRPTNRKSTEPPK
jgi:hypothetical protein